MPVRKRKRVTALVTSRRRRRKMTPKTVRAIVKDTVERSEPKFLRTVDPLGVTSWIHGSDTAVSVVKIPEGTTNNSRVGVKVRVARIYVKLRMRQTIPSTGQASSMTFRVGLDYVKPGIVGTVSGLPARGYFTKPDYVVTTRRVLWDHTFTMKLPGDGDMNGGIITFSKMITLKNHEVRWTSASAVNPVDGNILLWGYAECPDNQVDQGLKVESTVDTYYSEV